MPGDVVLSVARPGQELGGKRLAKGECSVGDLTDLVGSDRTTVSKHLSVLRLHGIVADRREGSVVYYTLLTPCVVNFFTCATQVLKERG